jgi:hypothetical protein
VALKIEDGSKILPISCFDKLLLAVKFQGEAEKLKGYSTFTSADQQTDIKGQQCDPKSYFRFFGKESWVKSSITLGKIGLGAPIEIAKCNTEFGPV